MKDYEYKGFKFQHFLYHWYAIKDGTIIDRDQYRIDLENRIDRILDNEVKLEIKE